MVNKGYIIVASGLEPVHSFDLFGPLVDATLLGEQQVTLFEKIADVEGIDGQNAASIISDYRALLRGESWAVGDRKKGILDALYNPLKKHPKLTPNYQSTFQSDGLAVLGEIYGAGEQAIVFSTIAPEWLRTELPDGLGERIAVYGGQKTYPKAFRTVYNEELAKGRRVVTHTADELPELEAALQSGLFDGSLGQLIFIARNTQISEEQARTAGIDVYVHNLRDVGYTQLVRK